MNLEETKKAIQEYFVRNRVSFGLLLGSGALIFLRPGSQNTVFAGLSVSFLGLLIRSWAAGCIKKSKSLCVEGPYAFVRHPLYLGSLLMSAGIFVAFTRLDSPWLSGIFWATYVLYFWSFYTAAVTNEEEFLVERFADEWVAYKTGVPAFLPFRMDQFQRISFKSFSFAQYNKNKEYNAVLGWMAIAVLIFMLNPLSLPRPEENHEIELASKDLNQLPQSLVKAITLPPTEIAKASLVPINTHDQPREPNPEPPLHALIEKDLGPEQRIALIENDEPLEELESPPKLSLINPWFGTAVLGTAALGLFDNQIRSNIQHMVTEPIGNSLKDAGGQDRPLDRLGNLSTGLGLSAGFYAVGSLSNSNRAKRVGVIGVQALITNSFLTEMIAHGVGRKAPSENDSDEFRPLRDNDSFPSPQTSSAFTMASVVAEEYDSIWVDAFSYGLASAVGFSRLSEDQHWASDVAGGALLGIFVGKSVSHFDRKKGWSKRLYTDGRSVSYEQKF